MAFKWLNKLGVESDKGFIVQCTDRFTSEYREGSKKITILLNLAGFLMVDFVTL